MAEGEGLVQRLLELADNGSVAALIGSFAGAVATYAVVAFTDRRRKKGILRTRLPELMTAVASAAQRRSQQVDELRTAMTAHNKLFYPYAMRFPVPEVVSLLGEVGDLLTNDQKWALRAALFSMETADEMAAKLHTIIDRHSALSAGQRTPSNVNPIAEELFAKSDGLKVLYQRVSDLATALRDGNLQALKDRPAPT